MSPAPRDNELKIPKSYLEDAVRLATKGEIPMQDPVNDTLGHNPTRGSGSSSVMLSDALDPGQIELAGCATRLGELMKLPFYERLPDSAPDSQHLESGLRAIEEGDGRLVFRADDKPKYASLRDSSVGGLRDVTFDGYFGDPALTDVGIDPAVLSLNGGGAHALVKSSSSRKRKRPVRNVSLAYAFPPSNLHADVSLLRFSVDVIS